jgi:hypothetical protein
MLARRSHQRSALDWALSDWALSGPGTPIVHSRHNGVSVPQPSSFAHPLKPDLPQIMTRHHQTPPLSDLPRVGKVVPPKPPPHSPDSDYGINGRRTSLGLPLLDDDYLELDSPPHSSVQNQGRNS